MTDSMKLSPYSSMSRPRPLALAWLTMPFTKSVSRCEGLRDERPADLLVRMVKLNLRIASILGDLESYRRLCFTSGEMSLYCGAFHRGRLTDCLLIVLLVSVLLRLSF